MPAPEGAPSSSSGGDTLLCFVLTDPAGRHAFCSRYDFGPWPFLSGLRGLPPRAAGVLRRSRALFVNGFSFDELAPEVVQQAVHECRRAGAALPPAPLFFFSCCSTPLPTTHPPAGPPAARSSSTRAPAAACCWAARQQEGGRRQGMPSGPR